MESVLGGPPPPAIFLSSTFSSSRLLRHAALGFRFRSILKLEVSIFLLNDNLMEGLRHGDGSQ